MARPTGQDVVAIESRVCYGSQEKGDPPHHGAQMGNTRVGQEAEGEGNVGRSFHWGFHRKEPVKNIRQV